MLDIGWTSSAHENTFIWWTTSCKCYCSKLICSKFLKLVYRWYCGSHCNLFKFISNQFIGIKSLRKHADYVSSRTLLILKSDCILPHWCIMECCANRKSICIILKAHFETTGFRRIMLQNMIVLEKCLHFVDNGELGDSYNKAA